MEKKKSKSSSSRNSRKRTPQSDLDYQAALINAVIRLQRFFRARKAKKDFENYQHTLILRNKNIARGIREIRHRRWFVNIFKRDDDKSIVSRLSLSQHSGKNVLNSTNVIVEVLPMEVGVVKPLPSHYNERELCEMLKIWNLDVLEESLQHALLSFVDIEEGVVKIKKRTKDSDLPQKRLLDSLKSKLGGSIEYKIRFYEVFEKEDFRLEICTMKDSSILDLSIPYEKLAERLGMSSKDDLTTRLFDVMNLIRVSSDGSRLILS